MVSKSLRQCDSFIPSFTHTAPPYGCCHKVGRVTIKHQRRAKNRLHIHNYADVFLLLANDFLLLSLNSASVCAKITLIYWAFTNFSLKLRLLMQFSIGLEKEKKENVKGKEPLRFISWLASNYTGRCFDGQRYCIL